MRRRDISRLYESIGHEAPADSDDINLRRASGKHGVEPQPC
jgi:hypothetical protein